METKKNYIKPELISYGKLQKITTGSDAVPNETGITGFE